MNYSRRSIFIDRRRKRIWGGAHSYSLFLVYFTFQPCPRFFSKFHNDEQGLSVELSLTYIPGPNQDYSSNKAMEAEAVFHYHSYCYYPPSYLISRRLNFLNLIYRPFFTQEVARKGRCAHVFLAISLHFALSRLAGVLS